MDQKDVIPAEIKKSANSVINKDSTKRVKVM